MRAARLKLRWFHRCDFNCGLVFVFAGLALVGPTRGQLSSGGAGTADSAPSITTQPQSQTVLAGANVTFSAAASGSPAPTFQWRKGGTNIGGANNASLGLSNVQPTDAGGYSFVVSNIAGSVTSATATLTVNAPAVVTAQPSSQTLSAGSNVTFSVSATGTAPLSYQWRKDGTAIGGANTTTLSLSNIQSSDAGGYTVVVSNAFGSATSSAASLTVTVIAPAITTQPQSQTAAAGSGVTFSVAAGGTAPLSYQWQKDGSAIAGATSASLSLSNVQSANAGSYSVVVSNSAGAATSATASLTITIPATAAVITAQPQSQTVPAGGNATLSVTATGTAPLSYQWRLNGTAISGATNSTLALTNLQSGGNYTVVVSNTAGSTTSNVAVVTVTVTVVAPSITMQPTPVTTAAGRPLNLNVAATGSSLTYQWQLNGANIAGATNSMLAIPSLLPSATGDYTVIITNSAGSVTSKAAPVTMVPGRLVNLSTLTSIGPGDPLTVGTVVGGKSVSGSLPLLIRAAGPSLEQFGVPGVLADPMLDVFAGSTIVAANDNWGGTDELAVFFSRLGAFPFSSPASHDAALIFSPNISAPSVSYTMQVAGVGSASGSTIAEVYDGFADSVDVTTPRLINMSVLKHIPADGVLTAGFVIGGTTPKQLLIRAVGPALGLAPFNVAGVMPDPKLTLFDGGQNAFATNDDWGGDATLGAAFADVGAFVLPATSRDAALLVTLAPGSYTAQIAPSTAAGAAQGGLALVEVYDMEGGAAPALSTPPASLSAVAGSTAMFSASAVGATGYQWQRLPAGSSIWVNLVEGDGFFGTTTSSLLTSASSARSGDQFRVVVTNSAGVTQSNPVSLTITAAPAALSVSGFTAPTVAPMSVITINATGLTPAAVTFVEFLNSSGELITQVPALAVSAASVSVAVPPLLASDGTRLVGGTLSARIVQLVGAGTVVSNAFAAAQVQAAPASTSPAGALTLSLLQAELDQASSLPARLPGSSADGANARAVVGATIQSLQNWTVAVQRAITSGTGTITIGTGQTTAQITLTARDLQAMDNYLVAGLQAMAAGDPGAALQQAAPGGRQRAATDSSAAFRAAAATLWQTAVNGSGAALLAPAAVKLTEALGEVGLAVYVQVDAVIGVAAAGVLAGEGLTIGATAAGVGAVTLAVPAGVVILVNGLGGFMDASRLLVANAVSQTAVRDAIDRRNGFLDAIAARRNSSPAALLELNGPSVRGFGEVFSGPGNTAGDYLRVASDQRHTSQGRVTVAPAGMIYRSTSADFVDFVKGLTDPTDAGQAFLFDANRYYPFSMPFTLAAVPLGSSVFTGWRVNSPFYNSPGTYQSAGRDSTLALQLVRGGYFVIATFDYAHVLTASPGPGNGGAIESAPAAARYASASGLTSPSYLHGEKVTLTARENSGFTFASWSGLDAAKGDTSSGKTAVVVMTADRSVTANFSASIPNPAPPPTAPKGLTATPGNQQVLLSWNASPGAASYKVFVSASPGGTTALLATVTTTTHSATALANGIPLYFVVTAVNNTGESVASDQVNATPSAGSGNASQFDGSYLATAPGTLAGRSFTDHPLITIRNGSVTFFDDTWVMASLPPNASDLGSIVATLSPAGALQLTGTRRIQNSAQTSDRTVTYTGTFTAAGTGSGTWTVNITTVFTNSTPTQIESGSGTWTAAR